MFVKHNGMNTHAGRPASLPNRLSPWINRGLFFNRAPVIRVEPREKYDETSLWPPGLTLLLASCVSLLLWAGLIETVIWLHRALGWF